MTFEAIESTLDIQTPRLELIAITLK